MGRRISRRSRELKSAYDVVIIGAGGHGLAAAYYLARDWGIRNIAVLEKGYLGGGNTARNTTIIRSNYLTPEGVAFYKESVELWRGLDRELDINLMYTERGHLTLAHTDAAVRTARWRAEVNKHLGVDSELIFPDEIARICPQLNLSPQVRYPILGALYHPPGAIARHDAVAWGYGREATKLGVEIHQLTEAEDIFTEGGPCDRSENQPRYRPCRQGAASGRRLVDVARRHGRVSVADPNGATAGLRFRTVETDPRSHHRVRIAACLHFAERAR